MALTVAMPQMGESVVEGTVEKWRVREGETVEKDQVLCEITTEKVDAEVVAPERGVVAKLLVPEGTTVEVGTELVILETSAATEPKLGPAAAPVESPVAGARDGARATPLARRIAAERGIDLGGLAGSGIGGRVVKSDLAVPIAPAAPAAAPSAPTAAGTLGAFLANLRVPTHRIGPEDRVIPFTAVRRRIAEHMVVSKVVSPHVGTVAEVDLSKLAKLREQAKGAFEKAHGFGLTYLPFAVAATVRALKDFPRMNSAVVGDAIVERNGIHVGVAVETERGLLVPVVKNADRLSLTGLAEAIDDLAKRARSKAISADELAGGTFTVSNPGREGNLYGFAVINQPQVGILRLGEVKKRVIVVERDGEDSIAIHPMMYLALSYDHRIIDGVTGNSFLYRAARYLEAAQFEL